MTEEEAKTKWCPFARAASESAGGTFNRILSESGSTHLHLSSFCIGRNCAAWRARYTVVDHTMEYPYGMHHHGSARTSIRTVEDGYCGLAGKPE